MILEMIRNDIKQFMKEGEKKHWIRGAGVVGFQLIFASTYHTPPLGAQLGSFGCCFWGRSTSSSAAGKSVGFLHDCSIMARDGAVKASELRMKTKVELEKQAVGFFSLVIWISLWRWKRFR